MAEKRGGDGTPMEKHQAKKPRLGGYGLSAINFIEHDGKTCTHEVAWPPEYSGQVSTAPPRQKAGPPAKEYAFKLDPFQQTSINCLEAGTYLARRQLFAIFSEVQNIGNWCI